MQIFNDLFANMSSYWLYYVVGYLFGIVLAGFPIYYIIKNMWSILFNRKYTYKIIKILRNANKEFEKDKNNINVIKQCNCKKIEEITEERLDTKFLELPYRHNASLMGGAERFLLILGFQIIPAIIISGWFAIKFASIWRGWGNNKKNRIDRIITGNDDDNDDKELSGRAIFNITIMGSFLNLIFSIISVVIITLGRKGSLCIIQTCWTIIIIILATIFFTGIILGLSCWFRNKSEKIFQKLSKEFKFKSKEYSIDCSWLKNN